MPKGLDYLPTKMTGKNNINTDDVFIITEDMQKGMIILGILFVLLAIVLLILAFTLMRIYQVRRSVNYEEISQMDQIDYLIGLLSKQEKMLDKMDNQTATGAGVVDKELMLRYAALHKEFSDQLEDVKWI